MSKKKKLKELNDADRKASARVRNASGHTKKSDEAWEAYYNGRRKIVRELLGKYADRQIDTFNIIRDDTYADYIDRLIDWSAVIDK